MLSLNHLERLLIFFAGIVVEQLLSELRDWKLTLMELFALLMLYLILKKKMRTQTKRA